jgi:hypothetical protein
MRKVFGINFICGKYAPLFVWVTEEEVTGEVEKTA